MARDRERASPARRRPRAVARCGGITLFESLAVLITLNLLFAGKAGMNLDDIRLGLLGALFGVGIGIGCL
jgi:hypothetical protein